MPGSRQVYECEQFCTGSLSQAAGAGTTPKAARCCCLPDIHVAMTNTAINAALLISPEQLRAHSAGTAEPGAGHYAAESGQIR